MTAASELRQRAAAYLNRSVHAAFTGVLGLLSSGKEGKRSVLKEPGDPDI